MCGFLVYKDKGNKQSLSLHDNFFIQKRGQDLTNKVECNGFNFVHNLLHITGEFTPQPYIDGNIVCLYNGEIYNHKFVRSDGENLIPLYKKYGADFPKYLDGEWAIALYDFKKGIAIFSTDLFATKPIWRKGLEVASYYSGVGGIKIPANTIEIVNFDVKTRVISSTNCKEIYHWDLRQYKDTYEDWISAFEVSVAKRATRGCFIGLSSGYDSGAIACELLKQDVDFKAYIVEAKEDVNILRERIKLLPNYTYIDQNTDFNEEVDWIKKNIEEFKYITAEGGSIKQDKASPALSKICRLAHQEGRQVYLSGQGSDEIIADYALFSKQKHTFPGGKFPDKLSESLWENFYDGSQYSYLGKEEYVAGSHSIETRYPFLDKDVVQEFLWLKPALKNKQYKAPLHEYLVMNHFPFLEGVKIGLKVKY